MQIMEVDKTIKVYKKRWLVLIIVSILMAAVAYSLLNFGPINNIIVAYFHVAYMEADWITLSTYGASFAVLPLLAYCSFNEMIDLKFSLLISAFSFLVNSIAVVVAFVNYKFFFVLILGQIFGAILNCTNTFILQ